jgi:hypothetical protein
MKISVRQYGRGFIVLVDGRRARRISTWGTRFIYVTRNVVVKVAACREDREWVCPFNVGQNKKEARRIRTHGGPHLPRLLASHPDGHWIAVQRFRYMRNTPWVSRDTYRVIDQLANKLRLRDVSRDHNWAMHRGRPVIYDLGV